MNHHDDHYADTIHDSYQRPATTAEVDGRVSLIIRDFERLRRQVRNFALVAGFALGIALAAVALHLVIR